MKEDVAGDKWLQQCKSTTKASIVVHKTDLVRLRQRAIQEERLPFMELEFVTSNPLDHERWYIVHEVEFVQYFQGPGWQDIRR